MLGRRSILAAVIAVAGMMASVASAGAAEAPRWDVVSTTNPTHLVPNSPRDEVQEVTVNATGGTFTLSLILGQDNVSTTEPLPYDASASEVQSELEKINFAGTVTGAGPKETSPYTITFGSFRGDKPTPVMPEDGSKLTGGSATVTVKEVTRGQYYGDVRAIATNVGGASTNGTATVSDVLPPGVVAKNVTGRDMWAVAGYDYAGGEMTCAAPPTVSCTHNGVTLPGDQLVVDMEVEVSGSAAEKLINDAGVTGGGAPSATVEAPLTVTNTPAGFGVEPGSVFAALSNTQAGAHPSVTTAFAMNTKEADVDAGNPRDIRFDLPPGLVGQAAGMPRCTMAAVEKQRIESPPGGKSCPSDSMVGMAVIGLSTGPGPASQEEITSVTPVYNIAPAPGEPVAFGFLTTYLPVRLDTSVLSNGDYGVRVTAPGLNETGEVLSSWITIWGDPAEYNGAGPDYDSYSAPFFPQEGWSFGDSGVPAGEPNVPLLTNPQQCASPLTARMETDSWQNPGVFVGPEGSLSMGTLSGCELLRFEPSFTMLPDTLEAGRPAGYSFNLKVPQRNEVEALATPTVRKVSLTLPAGTVVNPSAAWGLKACSNAQFYGPNHPSEEPALPSECPREAQVGKMSIKTPALEELLEGEVYLAEPECEPCTPEDAADGKMVRLFVNIVGTGESGIVVKLEGHGMIDQQTGQITTVFDETPQLPFSELKLVLNGGERAVLANPRSCGPVSSTLDMASWDEALPESVLTNGFEINQGCFGAQFKPSFAAGMPNIQAGANGEFTLAFGRSNDDEYLSGISTRMPPGLLGTLTGVELCKEAQANAGTCGTNSQIGSTQVLTGPGANPFLVEGGKVFLTEGYGGAQFGLSIVVPAVAGPYTLSGTTGNGTVVVRAQIFVDPRTAALTVASGPLPTVLDGIPLQLQAVNVRIDRPGFTFNPTSCAHMAITGTLSSSEGMSASVSSPFQVTNCASLAFKPAFKVSASGRTSRADGASLKVQLSYPKAASGSQANIHAVKVDLPKQLPSRLTTLQKACPAATFEANPAACPVDARVGSATASTPIIPVALAGPAYFVSYGGAKFPELVIVLSGYGVTVQLHGETFINPKTDITSSTFRQIPDVPIGSFELNLPEGPYSALAANGSLCKGALKMPSAFVAQNGAEIHESTPISVAGCPKLKKTKTKGKKKGKGTGTGGHNTKNKKK